MSWTFCTSATKISLLLLYIRVFPQREFRYVAYGFMGMVSAYCIGCTIFFLANCRPFAANWDITIQNACGNQKAGWLGTVSCGMTTPSSSSNSLKGSRKYHHGCSHPHSTYEKRMAFTASEEDESCSRWYLWHWIHVSALLFPLPC